MVCAVEGAQGGLVAELPLMTLAIRIIGWTFVIFGCVALARLDVGGLRKKQL